MNGSAVLTPERLNAGLTVDLAPAERDEMNRCSYMTSYVVDALLHAATRRYQASGLCLTDKSSLSSVSDHTKRLSNLKGV